MSPGGMSSANSSGTAAVCMRSLEQIIQANPAWPAIPGQGPWAGLPPSLQPLFADAEKKTYDVTVAFWVNLAFIGIIGYDWLKSMPADINLIYWPELQRVCGVLGESWPLRQARKKPYSHRDGLIAHNQGAKDQKNWHWPYPIIICHLLSRLMAPVYMFAVINNYRNPKSCQGALTAYFFMLGLVAVNGQVLLTLRAMAISKNLRYHHAVWVFLWLANLTITVIWMTFAFTAKSPGRLPTSEPLGFRIGVQCGQVLVRYRWMPMVVYPVSFVQDGVVFALALLSISSNSPYFGAGAKATRLKDRCKAWRSTLYRAMMHIFGFVDIITLTPPGSSAIATQFIADGAQVVLWSWVLELVGIIIVGHFLLGKEHSVNKTASILALHGMSLVIIPKTVGSLKRVAMLERSSLLNTNPGGPDASWPDGGEFSAHVRHESDYGRKTSEASVSDSNAPVSKISVKRSIQHHTEILSDQHYEPYLEMLSSTPFTRQAEQRDLAFQA